MSRPVLLALLLAAVAVQARPELLDRIVAVVDDQVVLWSELNLRTQLELEERGRDPRLMSQAELATERQPILDQMVDELVVVKKAEKDSLEVDDARVQEVLDAEFGRIQRNIGEAELTAMLERSGMTQRQLKQRYRQQIRHRLLYEQMVSELAQRVFVTRRDIEAYRRRWADTLPTKMSISQIMMKVTPADSVLAQARRRIAAIQAELAAGRDFADVARQYSEDPGSADGGGNLGCFSPGSLMPDFERAAMNLRPGQISDPVLTPYGYHLILLHERRENELCTSHILVRARTTAADRERVRAQLAELRRRALAGEDFAQLARDVSQDPLTARQGGLWQIMERTNLPPVLEPYLSGLGLGDISEPFFIESEGRIMRINDDDATLESFVREERVMERMDHVIADFRSQIHVEERLDEEWLWEAQVPESPEATSAAAP